ncbi:hypothetical protein C2845_PM13G14780 [Panicum miliaceum]|uniref:Probable magnesium transporter n=1 Tax=Panicum miliaceum TaxID=4540 RepID=A0A3L6RJ46_PANMI|nr:hypothetical protein C2845_PM13G14780 [Panicum miliaceum]
MSPAAPDAAGGDLFDANLKGSLLAVASSAFIGVSFIVKKKGLRRAGAASARAGVGGYGYLLEPLWWVGMVTMLVGEIANFIAYMFAPAVLVTPLGALSIIVSAVLAHFTLNEKLHRVGVLGCGLCIVGSTMIILHAPQEMTPSSVEQIWHLATQPSFLCYAAIAVGVSLFLMLYCAPRYGQTNIIVYVGICSVIGSLTVMSIKAVGIAIKLTIEGINQAGYFQTWVFAVVSATCIVIQLVYLNKTYMPHFRQKYIGTSKEMVILGNKERMIPLHVNSSLLCGKTTLCRDHPGCLPGVSCVSVESLHCSV